MVYFHCGSYVCTVVCANQWGVESSPVVDRQHLHLERDEKLSRGVHVEITVKQC